MSKILGLDLGTNSIGWALIDDTARKIIDCGVRIFPEGINRDTKGKEVSKNETRRTKRLLRRLYFRKKIRKVKLVKTLISFQLFPDIDSIFEKYAVTQKPDTKNGREKLFFLLNQVTLPDELKEFFSLNPYLLRAKAMKGEKLTKYELGRVFYQLSQRRGYKENLQSPLEDGKALTKGKPEEGTLGIDQTKRLIAESGSLGSAMFDLYESNIRYTNGATPALPERIRNRYTLRSMYIDEFEKIWQSQARFYPDLLNDKLKEEIGDSEEGILFFQRPLRNQKFLLGRCTFEPGKPKAKASSLWFERFRMHQFINTIVADGKPLDDLQRNLLTEVFNAKDKFEFAELRKKLGLSNTKFNYEDKQKIIGNKTTIGLKKVFGKTVWEAMSISEQDQAWEIKINAVDPRKTKAYLIRKWAFTDKQIEDFFKLNLSKDYASLSTTAIRNILPFLEKGKLYNDAVILSGIKNAFGKAEWGNMPESERREIEDTVEGMLLKQKGTKILDRVKSFLGAHYNLSEKQLNKLYHHSEVDEIQTTGQFPESDQEIERIKNPVVMASLFEVRKLVTQIIKLYGSPDEMRIEMARELKSGKRKREEIRFKQFDNERANDEAKKELDRYNKPHTKTNIRKILLYKELEKMSGQAVNPYNPTQVFSISKLFEDGYVQLEHIIPYSVSLDDSINNLTLCDAKTNGEKGDRTPFQYLSSVGADWDAIKSTIFKLLPYQKAKKFILESNPSLDDFIQRQLNDTRYISRFAKEYLKYVCPKVYITQGAVTSQLRHLWGLDSLLNKIYNLSPAIKGEYCTAIDEAGNIIENSLRKWQWSEGDKVNKKNEEDLKKIGKVIWGNARDGKFHPFKTRDDHRHHTVDAITIACTRTAFLQEISRLSSKVAYNEYIQRIADFPEPWPGFYQEARNKVSSLLVSYKKDKKILTKTRKSLFDKKTGKPLIIEGKRRIGQGIGARGELHEATFYGKRKSPGQEKHSYHIRKRLDELTPAMIGKVVDETVRNSIIEAIRRADPKSDITTKGFKIPDGAFFERREDGRLIPKVFLPNKNGNPIPIYRARIRENKSNAVGIKDYNVWVEPGNNHHLVIYDTGLKRDGIVVPFWDAVESKKQGLPVVNTNVSGQFVMSLQKGDMVLLDVDEHLSNEEINQMSDLHKKLYYLRKMSQKEKDNGQGFQIELVFVHHSISDINPDKERKRREVQGRSPNTFKGIKVEVSSLGKLERI